MPSRKPKLLVLDGQGVVFDAPIKAFLWSFARDNDLDYPMVESRWQTEVRHLAWTGAIDDEAVWNTLAGGPVSVQQTMSSLRASYSPGPVADFLAGWSRLVPIWLLSNHRSHWVLPQLDELDLTGVFQRLLISDTTGLVKPDPDAFRQLVSDEIAAEDILFVDDQKHNVNAADSLGLSTVHASSRYDWVREIDDRLRGCGDAQLYGKQGNIVSKAR